MNRLILLAATAVVLILANFMLVDWVEEDDQTDRQKRFLLSGLSVQAQALDTITISNNSGLILNAIKRDGLWYADNFETDYLFPIDMAKLRELVTNLALAKIVEEKTANPNNFALMGVNNPNAEGSQATYISMLAGGQRWELLVGNPVQQQPGRFVRIPANNQTYTIDQQIPLQPDTISWLTNPPVSIAEGAVDSVIAQGEVNWNISREGATSQFQLADMPASATLKTPDVLSAMVNQFSQIRFEDVLVSNAPQLKWLTQNAAATFIIVLTDNIWEINLYQTTNSDIAWLTVNDQKNSWQNNWAFQINQQQRDKLLVNRADFIQPSSDSPTVPANP